MDTQIRLDFPITILRLTGVTMQFSPPIVQVFLSMGRLEGEPETFVSGNFDPPLTITEKEAEEIIDDMRNLGKLIAKRFGGSVIHE